MLVIKAELPIDPDERREALAMMSDFAERSRAEDGIIDYRVATDIDDSSLLRFVEQYEDETAFDTHMQTDHVQKFMSELPDLLAGEVQATRFEVESASELEL